MFSHDKKQKLGLDMISFPVFPCQRKYDQYLNHPILIAVVKHEIIIVYLKVSEISVSKCTKC